MEFARKVLMESIIYKFFFTPSLLSANFERIGKDYTRQGKSVFKEMTLFDFFHDLTLLDSTHQFDILFSSFKHLRHFSLDAESRSQAQSPEKSGD